MIQTRSQCPFRRHVALLLVWTLLWALFFFTILVRVDHLEAGDFSGQFHAFGVFQASELAQGRLPAWSPGSYAGVPFAADPQAAVYYPPRILTILLSLPWGFSYYVLELEALLHVWAAGVFAYSLAFSITRRPLASLFGAVAFALGGYLTSYPLLQVAILETIAWLPLVLLLLRIGASQTRPVPWLVAAGMALGCSALAGHPQTWLHVAYLAAAYYLFVALRARWSWRWVLGMGALVAAVALGAWSAALWPTLQYLPYTSRSDVSYAFVSSGLPLLDYVQTLVPGVLSLWSPEYWGLAALLLALVALFSRHQAERGEISFWAVAAGVSAWLALGDSGILFELVYRVAPGFSLFQRQERLLGVFSLSCAMLAAQGMALWLHGSVAMLCAAVRRSGYVVGSGLIVAASILAVVLGPTNAAWLGAWTRQAIVLAAALALLWGQRRRQQRAYLLIALLSADLYVSTLGAVGRQRGSPNAFWPQPEWVRAIQSGEIVRVDSGGLFYGNLGELYGVEDIRGISPLRPRALEDLAQLPQTRRWQLLNVGYVLASAPLPDAPLTKVADVRGAIEPGRPLEAALYRFDATLPRAWMSYNPTWVSDRGAALKLLADSSFDPATVVILEGQSSGTQQWPVPAANPEVQVSRLSPGALQITVTTEVPGFLVISEWFYPGWQARLDGKTVPILRADSAFQAVHVPAGQHSVVVSFVPLLERMALVASLATMLLSGLVAWRWHPLVAFRTPAPLQQRAWASQERLARELPWGWFCATLIILAFALRVFRAWHGELSDDETFSYAAAKLPLVDIVPFLLRNGDPHSPFHYWLLHAWIRLAGTTELAMRFGALIPGVLLLPLAYRLGRRLADGQSATLLLVLLAASPSLVWVSQYARSQYTLALMFSVAATLLLLHALNQRRWWHWASYTIACALTLYSHYYGLFALIGHGFYVVAEERRRRGWWRWLVSVCSAGVAFAPWLLTMLPSLSRAGQLSEPSQPELANHLVTVGTELTVGRALPMAVGRWAFLLALMLCFVGAYGLWRTKRAWAVLLVGWLATALLGIYLVRFRRLTFNSFYILVAAPAWWLLVASGIGRLVRQPRLVVRLLALIGVVTLLGANAASLWRYYFHPQQTRLGHRDVARHLAAEGQPGDVFVANVPDSRYGYYLEHVAIPQTLEPLERGITPEQLAQSMAQLVARYNRLWFVPAPGLHWDPQGLAFRWLEHNALLEQDNVYYTQRLLAYRPLRAAEQVMTPVNLAIDGLIRLRAAFITVNGRPVDPTSELALPAGSKIQVTLLWETLTRPERGYTVFVHLLGEDGHLVAQHDGTPVFGTRPAATWTPAELLLDRHEFVVPAAASVGSARLLVGVYESTTITRQIWANGQDSVRLATVRFVDQ